MASYNDLGIIAETYDDLQAILMLERARGALALPRGSSASVVRTVFQAAEVALHNLADLTRRAAEDAPRNTGRAAVKLAWAHDFHRLLARLGRIPALVVAASPYPSAGALSISDSPAFRDYLAALRDFDARVRTLADSGALPLEAVLAEQSLDGDAVRFLHLARLSAHQARHWEEGLALVPVPAILPPLPETIGADLLRAAVFEPALRGDTFFTQFRGLHQIPELLGAEAGDLLEAAVLALRVREPAAALGHVRVAALLLDVVVESIHPLAANLTTADYHRIRENLGQTSGSHSVGLRYECFGDLYRQIGEAIGEAAADAVPADRRVRPWDSLPTNPYGWALRAVLAESLRVGAAIDEWRQAHLHLPRNVLGGEGTRSLSGSPDAIRAAESMLLTARRHDPLRPILHSSSRSTDAGLTPLARYLDSEASLDGRLLEATGSVTRRRFPQVQKRTGPFAGRCPFAPPPRRVV